MKKDWKTTIGGLIGVILIACGIFWPDKVDPETQAVINEAVGQILTGIGSLVTAFTLIFAKDSD